MALGFFGNEHLDVHVVHSHVLFQVGQGIFQTGRNHLGSSGEIHIIGIIHRICSEFVFFTADCVVVVEGEGGSEIIGGAPINHERTFHRIIAVCESDVQSSGIAIVIT